MGLNWFICLVYLDDVAIFSRTFDQHVERLGMVIDRIQEAGMKFNAQKCQLFQRKINFLSFVISEKGVEPDPSKVEAVSTWPVPKNLTELRAWLGLIGYYQKWIENFAKRAKPLFALMKKEEPFVWMRLSNKHSTT